MSEIPQANTEIEKSVGKLHLFCEQFVPIYRQILSKYNLSPGKIEVYLVGSVTSSEFKDDSDIDLKFYIENFQDSPELLRRDPRSQEPDISQFENPGEEKFIGFEIGKQAMSNLRVAAQELCGRIGLEYSRLHFLTFGRPITSDDNEGLLLYKSEN